MPKETKLFPEPSESAAIEGQTALVNQNPGDDIPFDASDYGNPVKIDEVLKLRHEMENLAVERDKLLDELVIERQTVKKLSIQLDEAIKVQPRATSGSLNHDIFAAIINGLAARGDLSLGKLSGDLATQQIMRHAAGITSFASQAVKDARL